MSKPFHPNAFRKQESNVDLSRLPEHIRQAFQDPVPVREHEIYVRVSVYPKQARTIPDARLRAAYVEDKDEKTETVVMHALDYTGKDPIAMIQISKTDLLPLIAQFVSVHRSSGGSEEELLEILTRK